MAQGMMVNQPKASGRWARVKGFTIRSYNQRKNQDIISKISRCFAKDLKSKSRWRLLKIYLLFKQEMMVKKIQGNWRKKELGEEVNQENRRQSTCISILHKRLSARPIDNKIQRRSYGSYFLQAESTVDLSTGLNRLSIAQGQKHEFISYSGVFKFLFWWTPN